MKDKTKIIVLTLILVVYGIMSSFSAWMADFISPIYNFAIAGVIIYSLSNFKRFKINMILLATIPIIWGLLDTIWFFIEHFTQYSADDFVFFDLLFIIPNLLMLLSACIYFYKNITNWNKLQLIVDILLVTFIVMGIGSSLVFKHLDYENISSIEVISNMIYGFTDVFSASILLIMLASSRIQNLTSTMKFVAIGFFMYIFADLIYIDSALHNEYLPNSISDFIFLAAFLHFAIGALRKKTLQEQTTQYEFDGPSNLGKTKIVWYVLFVSVVLFILGRISLTSLSLFFFAIMIYLIISHYVQQTIHAGLLLKQETDLKNQLELLVEERTSDLRISRDALARKNITDSLTHLFNRDYFYTIAEKRMQTEDSFSIIYGDLDRFKVINDLHGHQMGDQVLKVLAKRLSRDIDIKADLFRVGGDEFAIIIEAIDEAAIESTIKDIQTIIAKPVLVGDYEFVLDISIGVARYPQDGHLITDLVRHADIAMYHAKSLDTATKHIIFSRHLSEQINRRNQLELLLRNADYDHEFQLYYQPQIDTHTQQLTGMEALLRWIHPEEGFISPGEFIPIAEEIGLITPISDWVFEKAMKQIMIWRKQYNNNLKMGINLSPISINNVHFFPRLRALIQRLDVDPNAIEFEITEHSAMKTASIMEEVFTTLSNTGVHIAIDDFGTGYSSLSYLKRFDIDRLKIAKELIDNIERDSDDRLIVKAIIMMAKGMGLYTIAEGVETEEQYTLLKALDCDTIQGYYFGKPVPADVFERTHLSDS